MKTKFYFLACVLLIQFAAAKAQMKIGNNPTTINSASLLELETTNQGFVLPRVSITDVSAAAPLPAGLLTGTVVYNTNAGTTGGSGVGIYIWDGTQWVILSTGTSVNSSAWLLTGNSGLSPSANFIGTTDAIDFVAKTNNIDRFHILGAANGSSKAGWIGMGISVPRSSLDVAGDYTNKNVFTIQNTSNTGFSSVDMLDNSGVLKGTFGYANSGTAANFASRLYFNTYGSDFLLTSNSGTSHFFMKGGTGYIGLNTTTPSERLHLVGNFYLNGALMPGGNAGTSGYVLTSAGAGVSPVWANASTLAWSLTGNAGTNSAINFLGTTDNHPLKLKVNNTFSGYIDSSGGSGNTFFGYAAGLSNNTTGTNNTAIGTQALTTNTTGINNVATGYQALFSNTTGLGNTASGYASMYLNTTGQYNTAYGLASLRNNTTGNYNVAVGQSALQNNTIGKNNAVVGEDGLLSNTTGNYLAGVGTNVLYNNTTGSYNSAVGESTMFNNTTGGYNVAMGSYTLFGNTTASNNVALGYYAGQVTTTGGNNVFVGYQAGVTNTTGTNNTLIGTNSGVLSTALINAGAIGYNAKTGANNSLVLGDTTTGGNAVNVGIGVRNPLKRLHIDAAPVGSSSAKDSLKIDNLASSFSAYRKALLVIDSATGFVSRQSISTLGSGNFWNLTGNSGTNYATNFLGTTDNVSTRFRTNNIERMVIDSTGSVGIGSTNFDPVDKQKLLVDYGVTTSDNIATFRGSASDFMQVEVQNTSNSNVASSDFVASNDIGTDTSNYIDMGINSSTYAPGVENFGGPNDGYLYTYSRNLLIGTAAPNSDVIFLLGGGKIRNNSIMRLNASDNHVVIGKGENSALPIGTTVRGPNAQNTSINLAGGSLTLSGGSSTGTATGASLNLTGGASLGAGIGGAVNITGGTTSGGTTGAININAGINSTTNINTGTSTGTVTLGNSLNNINLPKLSASSVVLTDASKNLTSTTPLNNTYLYYDGTNFTWATAATLASFSATLPLTYNNTTGVFAINQATTTTNGYLSSTDWNTFNNKVGSITLNTPSSVFSNPINFSVSSGSATGTLSLNTQVAGTVFAGPANVVSGTLPAVPTFRALVAADIPSLAGLYIQNQTTVQALSNFNISGNGTIGTNLTVTGKSILTGVTNTGTFTSSGGDINLNTTSNNATNINTGTNTSNVTIGNSNNNILLPKFNTAGGMIYTAAATGQIASTGSNMTWDNTNSRLGIGITAPAYKLSVLAASDPLYLSGVQATAAFTTDSVLTIFNGVVKKAPYSSLPSGWLLTGNTGTSALTNFIGTTDAVDFITKTNNTERIRVTSTGLVGIGTNTPASNLTIYQSSGSGNSKGFTFTGNSIAGTNSGTGFLMSLGYNTPGNKQLWLGDGDYAGNVAGSFARFVVTGAVFPVFDAVSGDGSLRRYLAFGVSGDANSGVIFGGDNSNVNPGSQVWDNGNMAIGNGYRSAVAPANGLLVQGNVGIGTTNPGYALSVLAASNPLYLSGVLATATFGTDSVLTINAGVVKKTPYSSLTSNFWSLIGNIGTTASTSAIGSSVNNNFVGTADAKDFVLATNNLERMRILSNGNIGINTTTPNDVLEVQGPGVTTGNVVHIRGGNVTTGNVTRIAGDALTTGNILSIGSTSAAGLLNGSTALLELIRSGANASLNHTAYGIKASVTNTGINGTNIAAQFSASGANNNYAIIVPSGGGNVGINTSSPGSALDVKGTFRLSGSTSGYVGFTPPAVAGATTYTLPSADGASGQQLSTNGAGVLSWSNSTGTTTVSNTSSTNTLTTTVNGVAGTGVNIINSNATSLSGSNLTTTVNGVASTALDLTPAFTATVWKLTGNSGTTTATNFIGTTDAIDFVAKTNNIERMRILGIANGNSQAGWIGIATNVPASTLDVNGSVSYDITTTTTNLTLGPTHHTVIITGLSPVITLPAASSCSGRVYIIVNETGTTTVLGGGGLYIGFNAGFSSQVLSNSSMTLQSNGTNWYRIQ